jgi:hypothetical protein
MVEAIVQHPHAMLDAAPLAHQDRARLQIEDWRRREAGVTREGLIEPLQAPLGFCGESAEGPRLQPPREPTAEQVLALAGGGVPVSLDHAARSSARVIFPMRSISASSAAS